MKLSEEEEKQAELRFTWENDQTVLIEEGEGEDKAELEQGQKTMSALSNNSGGALIAPPEQKAGWGIKPTPFRRKSN